MKRHEGVSCLWFVLVIRSSRYEQPGCMSESYALSFHMYDLIYRDCGVSLSLAISVFLGTWAHYSYFAFPRISTSLKQFVTQLYSRPSNDSPFPKGTNIPTKKWSRPHRIFSNATHPWKRSISAGRESSVRTTLNRGAMILFMDGPMHWRWLKGGFRFSMFRFQAL